MSHRERFDAESVRAAWDHAADAYTHGQASGRDHYRYGFFGPAQVELCGDVAGLPLLDIGCGSGYFAREMARRGASVTAIDIAPRMIEHARRIEAEAPLGIDYRCADAARITELFAPQSFAMATSCLALQDMPDVALILRGVRTLLRPRGRLVFAIAHPCTNMPYRSWQRDASGRKQHLCIDRYFERGPIAYHWRQWAYDFTTTAGHAPLEDWLRWCSSAGFALRALREPRPSAEALRAHPDLEDAARVPYFLMLDLARSD